MQLLSCVLMLMETIVVIDAERRSRNGSSREMIFPSSHLWTRNNDNETNEDKFSIPLLSTRKFPFCLKTTVSLLKNDFILSLKNNCCKLLCIYQMNWIISLYMCACVRVCVCINTVKITWNLKLIFVILGTISLKNILFCRNLSLS